MNSELQLAFDHPIGRAEATAALACDRISVRDHVALVEIGAFQAERGTTQRLRFNVVVEVRPQALAVADDVDRILSYDKVTEAIGAALASERLNLLETLAERIAALVLREPAALRVFVRVEKLDRGPGALGVEIMRSHADGGGMYPGTLSPTPRVVHVTNGALADPDLCDRLDAVIAASTGPVVLCVGLPDAAPPAAGTAIAQLRIDLLAVEQNAWVLAARDPRCAVVHSRTEIDWALRHRHRIVWAPAKFVLDAVAVAPPAARDPLALAGWLARMLGAGSVVVLDAAGSGRIAGADRDAADVSFQTGCVAV